jgi:hypothetical protein
VQAPGPYPTARMRPPERLLQMPVHQRRRWTPPGRNLLRPMQATPRHLTLARPEQTRAGSRSTTSKPNLAGSGRAGMHSSRASLGSPWPNHPGEERGCPGLALRIWLRQLPRSALWRVLDDPGHFDLSRLCGLRRALAGAVGDDGRWLICMGRAVCRQPGRALALSEEALIGRSTEGQGLFRYPQVHAVCPCCDRACRRVLRTA